VRDRETGLGTRLKEKEGASPRICVGVSQKRVRESDIRSASITV
jgi:hypothetical protein